MGRMKLSEFLGHKGRDSGAAYLENWKDDKSIDILLHRKADIASKWTHGIVEVRLVKDKDNDGEEIPRFRWNGYPCWEEESVLTRQFKRDWDTGRRKFPPVICPDCLLLEWLREAVESGELSWTEPVFKFRAIDKDGDEEIKLYHAGGLYGAFGAKDMDEEQEKQLKAAKIVRRDAWKESIIAKMQYLLAVLPYGDPGKGIVLATETASLGDKVKMLISKSKEEFGDEEGDPCVNPYVIRWKYDDNKNTPFDKKYDATRMSKLPITPEMLALISEGDGPDLDSALRMHDPYQHRTMLEEACVLKKVQIPWDSIFGRACKLWDRTKKEKESKAADTGDDEEKPVAKPKGKAAAKPTPPKRAVELCEECGEPMKGGKCPSGCAAPKAADDPDDDLPF